jgi:hypothetical protein
MWYYVIGMTVCVVVGYLTSFLFPKPDTATAFTTI